jgi:ribose-phosphate pyrophosphokinase
MSLGIVAGTANPVLAEAVAAKLGTRLVEMQMERFPDGEICPCLGPIRGADVYVIQPTGPPVNDNLVELLLLLDACRRAGADRVTAVVPYFGYARQDRRSGDRRPIGARVAAEAIAGAGASRLVVVDPHISSLEAMFPVPVEMLTAVPVLAAAVRPLTPCRAVVVAPDLGAIRLARHFASLVGAELAAVSKYRLNSVTVSAKDIVGDVRDRYVVIVDDMISTGATIEAAASTVRAHGAVGEPIVVATHGLFAGTALARLGACRIGRMVVTDTVAPTSVKSASRSAPALVANAESIARLLGEAIGRLHRSESLEELLLRA